MIKKSGGNFLFSRLFVQMKESFCKKLPRIFFAFNIFFVCVSQSVLAENYIWNDFVYNLDEFYDRMNLNREEYKGKGR